MSFITILNTCQSSIVFLHLCTFKMRAQYTHSQKILKPVLQTLACIILQSNYAVISISTAIQMCFFTNNPNTGPLPSHLWHPTGWSVDCWKLQGPGWSRSDDQFAARLYPPHWWCELAKERQTTKAERKIKGQERKETGVRFFAQIRSMGTRKWIWKALYTLHFKCVFHEGGSEVERVYLDATDSEGFLWKCSSKGLQSQRDKNRLSPESWQSNIKMS